MVRSTTSPTTAIHVPRATEDAVNRSPLRTLQQTADSFASMPPSTGQPNPAPSYFAASPNLALQANRSNLTSSYGPPVTPGGASPNQPGNVADNYFNQTLNWGGGGSQDAAIANLNAKILQIQSSMGLIPGKLNELKAKIDALNKQIASLDKEKDKDKIEKLNAELQKLQNEKTDWENKDIEMKNELIAAQNQLQEMMRKLSEIEATKHQAMMNMIGNIRSS